MWQIEALQSTKDIPTLNLEISPMIAVPNARLKKADFDKKILVQLSEEELMNFASVMLGHLQSTSFKRTQHGIDITRKQSCDKYKGGLLSRASAGQNKYCQVLLPATKGLAAQRLAIQQLAKHHNITPDRMIESLGTAAQLQ